MVKKSQHTTITTFYKHVKEIDALTPMLPYLTDHRDCPSEIVHMNMSLTPIAVCKLLIRSILPALEDE